MSKLKDLTEKEMEELLSSNTGPVRESLNFDLHTIIMTVGPSGSGKTHFCRNKLIPELQKQMLAIGEEWVNIQYVSSDDMRRDVMGRDTHKHDPKMMHATQPAFELLHKKVDTAMQWPTNAQFIIVDTTGLSSNFRKKIIKQAKAGHYKVAVVVFDYDNEEEYSRYNNEDSLFVDEIMNSHIKKLPAFWQSKKQHSFSKVHKIASKDWDNYTVQVDGLSTYAGCFLDPCKKYDIISDIHGCYQELTELMTNMGYIFEEVGEITTVSHKNPQRKIVLVGDLIDKGPDPESVVKLVYYNPHIFKVVLGNHENFVAKWHKGSLPKKGIPPQEIIDEYFDCTHRFTDENIIQMLIELTFRYTRPFFQHPDFIVTHGPCKNKHLGKLDNVSKREQMKGPSLSNFRDESGRDKAVTYEKVFAFIKEEAANYAPYHIFGHVALKRVCNIKNKVFLDTACVHGGELTSISIREGEVTYRHVKQKADYGRNEELVELFIKDDLDI